ncbi:hypothetical protein BDN72DRAFT_731157, partial [Pluteus cervinus]
RTYEIGRKALVVLDRRRGDKFKKLSGPDVCVPQWIINGNAAGVRDATGSWLWAGYNGEDVAGVGECKHSTTLTPITMTCIFVDARVNWLRTRAQCLRWEEELCIVAAQMEFTVRSFLWKFRQWQIWYGMAEQESKPGHMAYAARQMNMWQSFGRVAEAKF